MASLVEDTTGGEILPSKGQELVADISQNSGKKATKSSSSDKANPLAEIKEAYEARLGEPVKKKLKTDDATLDLYEHYKSYKADDLKDLLRWNRQTMTGTKDVILFKVLDGEINGRLARCPMDGGRLKLSEDGTKVTCNGNFDEDLQIRIDCAYSAKRLEAPREKWHTSEPTEEEAKEMDRLEEAATGSTPTSDDPDVKVLLEAADKLEWKLINRDGIKKATADLLELLQNPPVKKHLDLPDDVGAARMKVGTTIANNREQSARQVLEVLIEQVGFVESKAKQAAQKEAAIELAVEAPENAALVAAFQELAELYFKEGNRNAGASYTKVVKALKDLPYAVTEDNAKGLGKGKTKVDNIGKSSADKIYEFVSTGTIAKLEEKRADVS